MAKRKRSNDNSSDREKWNKVFNQLVNVLQTQQTQLQFLSKERKLLESRIQSQYKRWVSDVNLFKDQISQMEKVFTAKEMEKMVDEMKSDLLVGLKQREAFIYKHKLDKTRDDLADFREWFDLLSSKLSSQDIPKIGEENRVQALENEVMRLKSENKKLTLDKNSEISALLAEKNFIWNQFNKMESDLKEELQNKAKLSSDIKELQVSKDNEVLHLKSELNKFESESIKKNEEISRLVKEIEMLKKSKSNLITPVLRKCPLRKGKNSATNEKIISLKKESDDKVCRRSKRKEIEVIKIAETTPKLFTSSFKVPKLKSVSRF